MHPKKVSGYLMVAAGVLFLAAGLLRGFAVVWVALGAVLVAAEPPWLGGGKASTSGPASTAPSRRTRSPSSALR